MKEKILILAICVILVLINGSSARTTVNWVYQITSPNTSYYFAQQDSYLMVDCVGTAGTTLTEGNFPAFVITRDSPMTSYTISVPTSTENAVLKVTGGTVLYDTINGNAPGVNGFMVIPNMLPFYSPNKLLTGRITLFIPSVSANDAGKYYCSYITGDDIGTDGVDSYANSDALQLIILDKSGQVIAKSGTRSLYSSLNYSIFVTLVVFLLFC